MKFMTVNNKRVIAGTFFVLLCIDILLTVSPKAGEVSMLEGTIHFLGQWAALLTIWSLLNYLNNGRFGLK